MRISLAVLIVLLLFSFCRPNKDYTSKPAKSLSHPDNDLLEMNAVAWHVNDSVSEIFLEILNDNLLYKRPDTSMAFYSELRVSYRLLNEANSRKILDSGSVLVRDRNNNETVKSKPLLAHFKAAAKYSNNYFLEIEALDLNKKVRYTRGLNIFKSTRNSAQNFLVTVNDSVVFSNHFLGGQKVAIKFQPRSAAEFTVDCYSKQFGPAQPPFSTKAQENATFKADSTFMSAGTPSRLEITMPRSGFVHIRPSTQAKEGLTLYIFDESFPGVSGSEEMIMSTRYIMNRDEFEQCQSATEKKAAIDKFWLMLGGSNERARELLKRYYSRVKEANKFFSSYMEGWKTDRGMIYIVFGPPGNTYQSKKDEVWVYGNEANPATLRFVFNKVSNQFTDNDFVMERSPFYRDVYYSAVDFWRQGSVYLEGRR
jgi:GWxTD domain-containing protein